MRTHARAAMIAAPAVPAAAASAVVAPLATLAAALALVACGSDRTPSGPSGSNPVATVTVAPPAASVGVGQTLQLVATAKDSAGNTLTGRSIAFVSSDASKASVTSAGLVSGVGLGSATITVQIEGKSAQAAISVVAGAPARIHKVSGDNQSGPVGTVLADPLVVRVTDVAGNAVGGAVVAWIIAAGDGTLSGPTTTTNASGQAEVSLTLGPEPGMNRVRASAASGASVAFTATGTGENEPPPPPPGEPGNFQGKWSGTMTWEEGDGNVRPAGLEVEQQGARADGTYIVLGGWRIPWSNGRVVGNTLTFEFSVPDGLGSNNTVQLTLNGAGNQVSGWHRSVGPAGTFTWVLRMARVN